MTEKLSRTLKVRGGIISQANRYLGSFCASQRIFPPQTIQVLLIAVALVSVLATLVVAAEFEGTVSAVDDKGMATVKATDGKEYKAQIAGVKAGDKVDCHVEGSKTSCHKLGKTHK